MEKLRGNLKGIQRKEWGRISTNGEEKGKIEGDNISTILREKRRIKGELYEGEKNKKLKVNSPKYKFL